jgi:anti-anti-sigma regulatory factor
MEFRECVKEGGRALSIFAFASVKAISQYTVEEILEMGIDGLWIGYEGTRSGYAKQQGRPVDELFRDLREHGISVLSSMIVGLPYQTPEVIDEELSGLLALRPTLAQFMIYGPIPGTPFFDEVTRKGLLDDAMAADPERYWKSSTGFRSMVKHPVMSGREIEAAQERCFSEDFRRLGPSIYRSLETWLLGHEKLKGSENPSLREKAARFALEVRKAYPIFLAGRTLAPGRDMRRWIGELQARIHAAFGPPTVAERVASVAGLAMAAWTGLALKLGLFQHPSLIRHTFRMPEESLPAKVWRRLTSRLPEGHSVEVELRPEATVWVRVAGRLNAAGAEELAAGLRDGLRKRKERLVLDFESLVHSEHAVLDQLAERLRSYQGRIRVVVPPAREFAAIAAVFAIYR